jgi:D-alanyl-D-alanine carboxypeptidase/D-alanyl-D-alanine-endopeptidase (penicillin-binding protein 4)
MSTPLLSVRRLPGVLSRSINLPAFRTAAGEALASLTDSECVSIAINGASVVAVNPHTSLRPASNVKLFTAAVALDVLGPAHTLHTDVRGEVKDGIVNGDLFVVGGGDPLLSSSWWHGSNPAYAPVHTTSIEELARRVRAAGVTEVKGNVVGDASRYDEEWYPPSWSRSIRFTEGGPVSALLVNDGRERPDKASADPAVGAATVFAAALHDVGVTVDGVATSGVAPAGVPSITGIDSHPLSEIVAEMLTTSDNNTAELLLKEIGEVSRHRGTREDGIATVMQRLSAWSVPTEGVELHDGSGLSDDNRATCAAIGALLDRSDITDPLGSGLPVAGASGGTLADAFVGTALEGRLRAKTGTLSNYSDGPGGAPGAKSLSGYVPLDGGGSIRFAMLLNGPTIVELADYGPIWKALGTVLAAYPSGPAPAEIAPR